ncbi:DUF6328 family protein [Streptomyces yaizuensis]|uniref:DUF6328 family protein n=1 Tax=Streptomyces yaizuensis TaxID=2989713 RepID=A0ABQ5P325_9ACTN|nr:DUF6328 family protein [Streptomyces sp. YSPA8]GLF97004.1 DUF6328 family protein [Streptomyces sp. YSPA8]
MARWEQVPVPGGKPRLVARWETAGARRSLGSAAVLPHQRTAASGEDRVRARGLVRLPGPPAGGAAMALPGPREAADQDGAAPAPSETSTQAYAEILQEVRVAQTALQFLLGFLMAVSVTPRFADFGTTDRAVYVASLVLALASFGLLTAPAPFHRLVSDPRRKHRLVEVSGRLALWGLVLLMLALTCAVLLVLSVVLHMALAAVLSACILCWLFGFWFCMPLRARLRDRRHP